MSTQNVSCQQCGKQYVAPESLAGKTIRCKACGGSFQIPLTGGMVDNDASLPEASLPANPMGPDDDFVAASAAMTDGPSNRIHAQAESYTGTSSPTIADEIDYEIFGTESQYVEITLDPGETVIAEAGAMMFMDQGIQMETVFGDPSEQGGGFWSKAMSAGKRMMTGESLFMTTFTHAGGHGRIKVGFGSPYPGRMIPLHLDQLGGEIILQKDAFLCGAKGIKVDIAFQKKIGAGLFGGEGFIMQRLKGDGIAIAHAGGTMMYRMLAPGETLRLDTGCLMGLGPSVNYDIQFVGGIKNTLFGGEGLFLATVTGPGPVWLQSLPFSRFAGRVMQSAPGSGGADRGEGSLLGGLGDMLMGDNS